MEKCCFEAYVTKGDGRVDMVRRLIGRNISSINIEYDTPLDTCSLVLPAGQEQIANMISDRWCRDRRVGGLRSKHSWALYSVRPLETAAVDVYMPVSRNEYIPQYRIVY